MKTTKKILAVMLGSVITASFVGESIPTEASSVVLENFEYAEFLVERILDSAEDFIGVRPDCADPAVCKRRADSPEIMIVPWNIHGNSIEITLSDAADADKYMSDIEAFGELHDMPCVIDYDRTVRITTIPYYDIKNVYIDFHDGYVYNNIQAEAEEFCAELIASGCGIESAKYSPWGVSYFGIYLEGICVSGEDVTAEGLAEAAEGVCQIDGVRDDFGYYFNEDYFIVDCVPTVEDPDSIYELWKAIIEKYPDCQTRPYDGNENEQSVGIASVTLGTAVDLLSDVDSNECSDLEMGSAVLTYYAKYNAGLVEADGYPSEYDINQDGVVNLSDAEYYIRRYALSAVGLWPEA